MVHRELVDSLGGHAEEFGRLRREDQRRQRRPFVPGVEHVLADSTAGFRLAVLACSLLGPRVRA
jgi:hypothetical protein